MARFEGFDDEIFDFCRRRRDADLIDLVRRTMERFGNEVLKGLRDLDRSFYREPHVGQFHPEEDDTIWVAFGFKKLDHLLESAHQTVSLSARGLDVYVRVGSVAAIDLLKRGIRNNEEVFLNIIGALPEPFDVQIRERTYLRPMRWPIGEPILTLEPGEARNPTSDAFMELKRLLNAIDYPHFSVRKRLNRKRVLELDGDAVVGEVFCIMKAFHPLVAFINGSCGDRREHCTSANAEFDLQQLEAQVKELEAQIAALTERKGGGGP